MVGKTKKIKPAVIGETAQLSPPSWIVAVKPPHTAAQVRRLLSKLIASFIKQEVGGDYSKTVCYLCVSYLTALRDSDLEQRIEALERGAQGERT